MVLERHVALMEEGGFADFEILLKELNVMTRPRQRRPNEKEKACPGRRKPFSPAERSKPFHARTFDLRTALRNKAKKELSPVQERRHGMHLRCGSYERRSGD